MNEQLKRLLDAWEQGRFCHGHSHQFITLLVAERYELLETIKLKKKVMNDSLDIASNEILGNEYLAKATEALASHYKKLLDDRGEGK